MAAGWAIASAMMAAVPATAQDATVRALVDQFDAARSAFDPAALAATLAPDYEEISPIGDVDSRAQVLGFYTPAKKMSVPPMTTDEVVVRSAGPIAVVTLRKSFAIPGAPTRSIRVRYLARRTGTAWRLVSTQYTPIPIKR